MSLKSSKLPIAARVVLGAVFLVFGLNGFFHFLPQPPAPPRAMAFAGALAASGYFFPLLKATEVVAGALLLLGFVPIALILLAPIVVNIVAFHVFLAPGNYAVVGLVLAAGIYLAIVHRAAFAPLFARPAAGPAAVKAASRQAAHRIAA
jgi:putative oxidoreductase